MKRYIEILLLTLVAAFAGLSVLPVHATGLDSYSRTMAVYEKSPEVRPFVKHAYGYAVFPTVGKGGFVVGGAYGKGRVYKQGKAMGEVSLFKASVGLQLGGQAFSEVIFFEDARAFNEFTSGQFEFDASASAVAVTAGLQARSGTDGASAGASAGPATGVQTEAVYRKGMAIFIHTTGGLMYEASVGGQKFVYKGKRK